MTDFYPLCKNKGEANTKACDTSSVSVRGRLQKCLPFWKSLETSKFFLDLIESACTILLFETPSTSAGKNNTSAHQNASFVTNAINELLLNNCIEEIPNWPRIVNPLSVSTQPSGKQRLILDLRHVNQCIYKQKFKCEDIRTIVSLMEKDYFLFNFDLKSAYHVEICPDHRQYLCFAWEFSPQVTRYFQFCVLPFGLSSTPYLSTKLLKPLLKKWRQQGIPIAVYLDNSIGTGKNILVAKRNALTVHSNLIKAGFLVNEEKSNWEPVQVIVSML